jgi:hypothetical protein
MRYDWRRGVLRALSGIFFALAARCRQTQMEVPPCVMETYDPRLAACQQQLMEENETLFREHF